MKRLIIPLFAFTLILHIASAHAETYNLIGQRYLRLYTAPEQSQAYNAGVEAQKIANSLCNVPWTKSSVEQATTTAHSDSQLDENVTNRGQFDAALFCAHHTNETHRAYANAAVYRYRLPEGSLPHLTRLTANVSSDPYNALGARIVLYTNSTGEIPTDCATCRGDVTGGIKLAGVSPRVTRKVDGKDYWYPNTTNAVFTQSVQLQKYLFVFVLMENYASSRGNWLEGCSYMKNLVSIETDAAVPGWADGSTVNLMEIDTGTGDDSLDDLMAYYETTQTVVTATHLASGRVQQFTAPAIAYRKISVGSTNLTSVTHAVLPYGDIFVRGTNAVLSSGWRATAVLGCQRVAVIHADVMAERGFETYPPTKPFTQFDRTFAGLPSGSPDTDGDGIADGWELYVGADPTDRSDGMSDWDNDGLTLAEEFDHGYWPTDPREVCTGKDTIRDFLAYQYHLKGEDAGKDFDGDGLSNYAEFLVSEVFRFGMSDPDRYATSDGICDYFRKVTVTNTTSASSNIVYVGSVFTDHDRIDDEWERRYNTVANPGMFDPFRDDDQDGWPNYEEFMAGTDPTTSDCPRPEVRMKVTYNSVYSFSPPVVVMAWNDEADPGAIYMPDAVWTLTNDFYRCRGWVTLPKPDGGNNSLGHLRKGKTTFIVYATNGGDTSFKEGIPLGVVCGVDVGWQGAEFTVDLTHESSIAPRINVFNGSMTNGIANLTVRREGSSSNILERTFNSNSRTFLCEADFTGSSTYDIEWGSSIPSTSTSLVYVVESQSGTLETFARRFESNKSRPVVENVEAICYGARPTFRWSLPDEESFAKRFGTSYTAFKLQVWSTDGKTKIYDSGVRRAPAQDKDGVFSWTADLSAGDLTAEGKIFVTPSDYQWTVAMYNAKFQPVSDGADMFAEKGRFSIAANTQQEMNDHQYSSIDVAVKYAGPANVIAQYADLTTLKGKVRVQAFATADFAGEPLSETVVTAKVDDFTSTVANARLVGLDATGTYYIRAYIDSDGDHTRSEWESWGAAKTPVVLTTALRTAPLVGVWIEDTDVDQDWLPDAWEYVKFGTIAKYSVDIGPSGRTIFSTDMPESAKQRLTSLSTGLEGASLTIFENGSWAKTLLDWGGDGSITFDDIRAAVQGELDVKSGTFKITSLTLGPDGKVTLTVDAEVAPTIAGKLLTTVYGVTPGGARAITLKVYRRDSLASSELIPVGTYTVQTGAGSAEIEVNVGLSPEDLISGLYEFSIE